MNGVLERSTDYTPVEIDPKRGGTYIVGAYRKEPPYLFDVNFALFTKTVDQGGKWQLLYPAELPNTIEYWFELPPHPKHKERKG